LWVSHCYLLIVRREEGGVGNKGEGRR
jgi:hypothetical protein